MTQGAQIVVLVAQRRAGRRTCAAPACGVIVPPRAIESRSLVAYADALVSAGGSMNREAAALGTPVWSMFEGRLGGVDERARARRAGCSCCSDPSEVVVAEAPRPRRPAGHARPGRAARPARLALG